MLNICAFFYIDKHISNRNNVERYQCGFRAAVQSVRAMSPADNSGSALVEWRQGAPVSAACFPAQRKLGKHSVSHVDNTDLAIVVWRQRAPVIAACFQPKEKKRAIRCLSGGQNWVRNRCTEATGHR